MVEGLVRKFAGFHPEFQEFENYTANAYFWLFSGLLVGMPGRASAPRRGGAGDPGPVLKDRVVWFPALAAAPQGPAALLLTPLPI